MLEQKFLDRFDMERRIQSRLFCFGSGASDDDGGGDDDSFTPPSTQVERGRGRTTSSPPSVRSVAPPQDDGPDPAQRLASVVGIPPTLIDIAQSASPEVRAANTAANDAAFERFFAELPPVTNLGNIVATPIVDVAASDTVNMPGSFGRTDTTGNEVTNGSYFSDLGAGLERIDGSAVPIPPPPRFQTNEQRDFFENLAGQGDDAINAFRSELRNLDNRGPLGSQIARGIGNEGVPDFDTSFPAGSQIRGVTTTNFVDLPFVGTVPVSTYTGLGNLDDASDTSSDETVPPVTNPLTGRDQCPDGFVFDEDLQACRRKTRRELQADNGTGGDSSRPAGDMFFRRTSLDDAPANLPSGFDFDAANRAFTQSFAVRPSFFQRPPDLTGFTLL